MNKDIKLTEDVHQWATKLVLGIGNLKYAERLKNISLIQMTKNSKSDLIETYKIIYGNYNINSDLNDNGLKRHEKNCSRDGLDWMSENMYLIIEWLISGMHFQSTVLLVTLLTHLTSYG